MPYFICKVAVCQMARLNIIHSIKRHGYLVSLLHGLTLETKLADTEGK